MSNVLTFVLGFMALPAVAALMWLMVGALDYE